MIKQDYLLRLIQELGEFFRRTLQGDAAFSKENLDSRLEALSEEILGLPQTMILSSPPEEIVSLFQLSDRMVVERCYLTAEIHRLKASVEKNKTSRKQLEERAAFFFSVVLPDLSGPLANNAEHYLKELTQDRPEVDPE